MALDGGQAAGTLKGREAVAQGGDGQEVRRAVLQPRSAGPPPAACVQGIRALVKALTTRDTGPWPVALLMGRRVRQLHVLLIHTLSSHAAVCPTP